MEHKGNGAFIFLIVVVAGILTIIISGANDSNISGQAKAVVLQRASCVKSGGYNIYVKGIATYNAGYGIKYATDYCRNYNSNTLVEYYCSGVSLKSNDTYCLYGCSNGACNQTKPLPERPVCGNNIVQVGEQCDRNNLNGTTCQKLGFTGGTLNCTPSCTFITAGCIKAPVCGNQIVEGTEQCDGSSMSCSIFSKNYNSGTVTCSSNCIWNTANCRYWNSYGCR